MTLRIFEYLRRAFHSIFYRTKRETYSKDFIKRTSEKTLSEGVFRFFTPEYLENGVYLSLKDRSGLIDYIKNKNSKKSLEEKATQEGNVDLEELNYSKKDVKEHQYAKGFPFEYGFEKTREFLKNYYSKFTKVYDSISLKFSEKYFGWKYSDLGNELNFEFGKA
jgi:hypothetical protein